MAFIDADGGGLGSTPFGSFFGGHGGGGGSGDGWGQFPGTMTSVTYTLACESCGRHRRDRIVGAFTPYGAYVQAGAIYVVGSDFARPTGCYSVELVGEDGEYYAAPLTWVPVLPPPLVAPTPDVTLPSPPPGASIVDTVLSADLPEVLLTQEFTIWLVNTCAGTRVPLIAETLESPPMLLTAQDADLGSAPRAWLSGQRGRMPASALSSGLRLTLPFDKCLGVIEYSARLETLPSAQGFTHAGAGSSGDYQLIPGGLLAETTATLPSYWSKTLVLGANPTEAYLHARMQPENEPAHATGAGMRFAAQYAQFVASPYAGLTIARSGQAWYLTEPDLTGDGSALMTGAGWTSMAAYTNDTSDDQAWSSDFVQRGTFFGLVGSAGAFDAALTFGDVSGSGLTAVLDTAVASFGGRFIRPRFSAIAPVASPVVRIYGYADSNSSTGKLICMRVRAAPSTSSPYAEGAIVATAILNVTASGATFTMDFSLPGMTAGQPFSFTLERVWDSAQDTLDATFHVEALAVRSS